MYAYTYPSELICCNETKKIRIEGADDREIFEGSFVHVDLQTAPCVLVFKMFL